MLRAFKYLRIIVAIFLPLALLARFMQSLIVQLQAILDGPLAHYMHYAYALNKIAVSYTHLTLPTILLV